MSIPAEYLLPQDMVLLRDLETGVVTTTHATDANEALANGGDRYELVLPNHLPRARRSTNDASLRPLPSDTTYLAADLRAADPERKAQDDEHAKKRAEEAAAKRAGAERLPLPPSPHIHMNPDGSRETDEQAAMRNDLPDDPKGFNPADEPQSLTERADALKGPLDK